MILQSKINRNCRKNNFPTKLRFRENCTRKWNNSAKLVTVRVAAPPSRARKPTEFLNLSILKTKAPRRKLRCTVSLYFVLKYQNRSLHLQSGKANLTTFCENADNLASCKIESKGGFVCVSLVSKLV